MKEALAPCCLILIDITFFSWVERDSLLEKPLKELQIDYTNGLLGFSESELRHGSRHPGRSELEQSFVNKELRDQIDTLRGERARRWRWFACALPPCES